MKALEFAGEVTVSDPQVLVAGDWHGDVSWVRRALAQVRGVSGTLLHVGDFSGSWAQFLPVVDDQSLAAGISRVLVTPGNHEPWNELTDLFDPRPGTAVRVSEVVWVLPRGFRFALGPWGYRALSLGGASSVDFESRRPGLDWWLEEAITDGDVARAIADGPADVMLTHDTVNGSGVMPAEMNLVHNSQGWSADALRYSAAGRRRVTQVWDALHPELLIHGHMHARGTGQRDDGRRVESMHMNGHDGNLAVLDTTSLELTDVQVRQSSWLRGWRS